MLRLADDIEAMPERRQLGFALCVVERVLVANSMLAASKIEWALAAGLTFA